VTTCFALPRPDTQFRSHLRSDRSRPPRRRAREVAASDGHRSVATSPGIVIPVLKDAGQVGTPLGQLVVAGASIAEIATIVLLSLFFSGEATGVGAKLLLLGLFGLFVLAVGVAVLGAEQSMRISATLLRLQDTTAEIRIRAAFLLLAVFVVLAERLALRRFWAPSSPARSSSLSTATRCSPTRSSAKGFEAVGYGVFVPVFFVATGRRRSD
jgi:Kef-type K+ transport system membrane component KefB